MTTQVKIGTETTEDGSTTIFSLGGHLDATMVNMANEKIQEILDGPSSHILFDLKDLNYISSAGLRILVYAAKKMKAKNGGIALCSVSDNICKVLEISGMDKFLPMFEDRQKAIEAIQ
ncbi:MAG: STAS domain-containing protein [Bacteriovoracales bacterium]|nr:STAS domain-containing protein [Bacteriovoracales bacterium]